MKVVLGGYAQFPQSRCTNCVEIEKQRKAEETRARIDASAQRKHEEEALAAKETASLKRAIIDSPRATWTTRQRGIEGGAVVRTGLLRKKKVVDEVIPLQPAIAIGALPTKRTDPMFILTEEWLWGLTRDGELVLLEANDRGYVKEGEIAEGHVFRKDVGSCWLPSRSVLVHRALRETARSLGIEVPT